MDLLSYDADNRVTYDEPTDSMYIFVYKDKESMVSIDTDEVNTQVGIEIIGVSRLMEKFKVKNNSKNN